MSNKLDYIIKPGHYNVKEKNIKYYGLDFSAEVRAEMRANGYPTRLDCNVPCDQPNICDLLTDCNFGGGGSFSGVQTDSTLAGTGLTGNILKLAQQGATVGQGLVWNGTTWVPSSGNTYTNGLTKTGTDVEWGGTLEQDTTIIGAQKAITWSNTGRIRFFTDSTFGNANSQFDLNTLSSLPITVKHTQNANADQYAQLLVDSDGTLTRLEQRLDTSASGVYMTGADNVQIATLVGGTNTIKAAVKVQGDYVLLLNLPIAADDTAAGAAGVPQNGLYKTATGEIRIKL